MSTEIGKELYDAFSLCGFVYLENHGIAPNVISDILDSSRKFFEQSPEDKMKIARHPVTTQGYVEPGKEMLDNLKEKGTSVSLSRLNAFFERRKSVRRLFQI